MTPDHVQPPWEPSDEEEQIFSGKLFKSAVQSSSNRLNSVCGGEIIKNKILYTKVYKSSDYEFIARSEVIWTMRDGDFRSHEIHWRCYPGQTGHSTLVLDD